MEIVPQPILILQVFIQLMQAQVHQLLLSVEQLQFVLVEVLYLHQIRQTVINGTKMDRQFQVQLVQIIRHQQQAYIL